MWHIALFCSLYIRFELNPQLRIPYCRCGRTSEVYISRRLRAVPQHFLWLKNYHQLADGLDVFVVIGLIVWHLTECLGIKDLTWFMDTNARLITVLRHTLVRPSKPFSLAWRSIVGLRTGISSTPQSTNISARQDTRLKTQMSRSWIRKYAGMNVEWRRAFMNVSRSRLSLRSSASTSRTYGTRRSARFLATSQMPNNQANQHQNNHIQAISKLMVILQSEEVLWYSTQANYK